MLDPIIQSIEKIITDFSWKRILVYLFIILSVVASVGGYELYTNSFELARIQKIVSLLESLATLDNADSPMAQEITSNILTRLESLTVVLEPSEGVVFSQEYIQAFWGAFPWLLFLLIYTPISIKKKEVDWQYGVIGLGVIAIIVGVLASLVPTTANSWIRFGVVQLANILVFAVFYFLGSKDDEKT